ncbi:sensor histidine kinase [Mesorhizobium mediterraneum]|uniref:sensor histidine kinase n=1 Tax=Mesorhizobium mediterraneum TaxID=43617 RepID=UPI00177E95F4|nr:sensor histidine kinase [Mesorhizobium mediterraneum]
MCRSRQGSRTQPSPNAVQYLGIAFHELATNSAKYGVLGGNAGKISVVWDVIGSETARLFSLGWTETDGSRVQTIGKGGFGTVVLKRVAPEAVGGKADLQYNADGVSWALEAPMKFVEASPSDEATVPV